MLKKPNNGFFSIDYCGTGHQAQQDRPVYNSAGKALQTVKTPCAWVGHFCTPMNKAA
jgi:hypothetical protein